MVNNMAVVEQGNTIKVNYVGRLDDGTVFDSSDGKEPLQFKSGANQVIPGFDKEILGMQLNQEKDIKIPVADAYGKLRPELRIEVPIEPFVKSQKMDPKPGMIVTLKDKNGSMMNAIIKEINVPNMILDFNHPLAGQNLNFHIKVVEIVK